MRFRVWLAPAIFACCVAAQSFEVATVKPHFGEVTFSSDPQSRGLIVAARALTVLDLIAYAYGVRADEIVGGEDWVRSEHYDIDAKVMGDAEPTLAELRVLTRNLLIECGGPLG
jgi:uncharacterized protein (TIGR03435 family)